MASVVLVFLSRCLLVMLFLPFSALDKLLNREQAIAQASQAIPARSVAIALLVAGGCVEILMPLAILTGFADRLAACVLAAYCIVTAVLWKRFWATPDFRLRGPSQGREMFWDFLKNLALAGGLLMLAFGSNAAGVGDFLAHPLASSHPYDTHGAP